MDKLVDDAIPNIRFNVAKSYAVLIDVLKRLPEQGTIISLEKNGELRADRSAHAAGGSADNYLIGQTPSQASQHSLNLVTQQILPNLEKLEQDEDIDVRYFATTAAQAWGQGGGDNSMHMSP